MKPASAANKPADLARDLAVRIKALPNQRATTIRALRREFTRALAKQDARAVVETALRLMQSSGDFAPRFVAYELLSNHKAALKSLRANDLAQFGKGLDSWEDVDTFACYVAGPAWREGQVPDALIHRWAHSPDRWWRRTALVSTVALNNRARGGRGDRERTLAVCALLLDDRDDMVVKALSWALRELSKREPQAVGEFVAQYQDRLAARVKREVHTKLTTGVKNPKRRKPARE
jgi:3-methyladenine DNA glycosylase AlkD